jgi:hypothetical protein
MWTIWRIRSPNTAGIDDEAIASAENMLLTFTNVRNEVGKGNDVFDQATKAATDMSVALGTDVTGAAKTLGIALNDPVKGMSKLQKAGVTFTQQQKDQVAAMVANNNTMGAQKVILAELSKEFGGSAAAQATASDKMKVALGNLEEEVGQALLPVIEGLANFLTDDVIPAFSAVVGWVKDNQTTVKILAGTVAGLWAAYKGYKILTAVSAAVKPRDGEVRPVRRADELRQPGAADRVERVAEPGEDRCRRRGRGRVGGQGVDGQFGEAGAGESFDAGTDRRGHRGQRRARREHPRGCREQVGAGRDL